MTCWTPDLDVVVQILGTYFSKNRVPPRTAQAALRHSSLDLTMLARRGKNVHTELGSRTQWANESRRRRRAYSGLLGVADALGALPGLLLGSVGKDEGGPTTINC